MRTVSVRPHYSKHGSCLDSWYACKGLLQRWMSQQQITRVLVLLVNSPVHRLFRLPTNAIIASSNTLPRRSQQFHFFTQITCALTQRCHVLHPLKRRLRERPNHMGSQRGAVLVTSVRASTSHAHALTAAVCPRQSSASGD